MKKFLYFKILSIIVMVALTFAVNSRCPRSSGEVSGESDEMRGVWVSTVFGIDFPSAEGLSAAQLKSELDAIVQNAADMGFNAIFFQVRPACDAMYKSDIFPWSKYLTGRQGAEPPDGFDPLEYIIERAHEKKIALHAWINPFRVSSDEAESAALAENNPALSDGFSVECGGKLYLNPGLPEVRDLVVSGVSEILERYDADGIHMDDYFYPSGEFDDSEAFAKYGDGKNIEDWRRENVDALVSAIYDTVKAKKPSAKFGISPAGVWANRSSNPLGSDTKGGNESYYAASADSRGWVKKGIVDYIAPQIYWNIGFELADYATLCDWWSDVTDGTAAELYIGMAAYKAAQESDESSAWYGERGVEEIKAQIERNRAEPRIDGEIMFTYHSLIDSPALREMLTAEYGE